MTYNCEHCGKTFSNQYILKTHQETAQYCIKIQQNIDCYKCKGCNRTFQSKASYKNHQSKCLPYVKQRWTKLLRRKESVIRELEAKLENCAITAIKASKPSTNTINIQINNLAPITEKLLQDNVKYLTLDHIKAGAAGLAKYALEYPLKGRIICTDYARRKLKYKNEEGNIVSDPGGHKISYKIFKSTKKRSDELAQPYMDNLQGTLWNIPLESKDDLNDEELESATQYMNSVSSVLHDVISLKNQMRYSINGDKTDLQSDFVKYICAKTVV